MRPAGQAFHPARRLWAGPCYCTCLSKLRSPCLSNYANSIQAMPFWGSEWPRDTPYPSPLQPLCPPLAPHRTSGLALGCEVPATMPSSAHGCETDSVQQNWSWKCKETSQQLSPPASAGSVLFPLMCGALCPCHVVPALCLMVHWLGEPKVTRSEPELYVYGTFAVSAT